MFLWYPVLDLARAPRRAARKKGSGYENACHVESNQKIKNPDRLEALLKTLYFLFKCMFLPELGFLCSQRNYLQ
jgi:hypothetical protein